MVEIARMVADWLSGTTLDIAGDNQGVAVQLTAMTFDGTDGPPTAPSVVDESRDGNAARDDYAGTLPALVVSVIDWRMDSGNFSQAEARGTAQVLVRYIADNATSAHGVRDGYYVLRAVRRSLNRLHGPGESNNGRLRNSVAIIPDDAQPLQFLKMTAAREDADILTGVLANYIVMDLAV